MDEEIAKDLLKQARTTLASIEDSNVKARRQMLDGDWAGYVRSLAEIGSAAADTVNSLLIDMTVKPNGKEDA